MDKVLITDILLKIFNQFKTIALSSPICDHTLILTQFYNEYVNNGWPFKYVNTWHTQEGYHQAISQGMNQTILGDNMHKLIFKLNTTKMELKIGIKQGEA